MDANNYLTIRGAKIIFRNFSGKPSQYSPEGRRTFSLVIDDPTLAEQLTADGWNVKPRKSINDNDPPSWHLPVAVFFGKYPPKIILKNSHGNILIDESSVNMLDWAEIVNVDLTIRPRKYEALGRTGIKAYLKTLAVTVIEDEIEKDYPIGEFGSEEDCPF